MPRLTVTDLGDYLREQREAAQLSLRQLSELAGVSNPYLSQIERGLRHPSAEILNALAKGLQISAESLYVRAGLLDVEPTAHSRSGRDRVVHALEHDPALTDRQRRTLVDLYDELAGHPERHAGARTTTTAAPAATPTSPARRAAASRRRTAPPTTRSTS